MSVNGQCGRQVERDQPLLIEGDDRGIAWLPDVLAGLNLARAEEGSDVWASDWHDVALANSIILFPAVVAEGTGRGVADWLESWEVAVAVVEDIRIFDGTDDLSSSWCGKSSSEKRGDHLERHNGRESRKILK